MSNFIVGEVARLSLDLTDASGVAADPGDATLKVGSPSGVSSVFKWSMSEVTRTGVGLFFYDLNLSEPGIWLWRWETTTPNQGALQGSLDVGRAIL